MTKNQIDLSTFNFNDFKLDALDKMKYGQSLTGKDGILTPLIKELFKAPSQSSFKTI